MLRALLLLAFWIPVAAQSAEQAFWLSLNGDWRMSPDDRPECANPSFDDSRWRTIPLPHTDEVLPSADVHWLRRTVELPRSGELSPPMLTIGPVSEVYEVYVNGVKIGETGPFFDDTRAQVARTRIFPLPPSAIKGGSRLSIALRTRGVYFGSLSTVVARGGSYLLSDSSRAPWWEAQAMIDRQKVIYSPRGFLLGLLLFLSLLTALLWLAERERKDLLWISVLTGSRAAADAFNISCVSLSAYPLDNGHLIYSLMVALVLIALVELALATFHRGSLWVRVPLWIATAVLVNWLGSGAGAFVADTTALLIIGTGWWRGGRFRQPAERSLTCLIIALLALVQMQALGGLRFVLHSDLHFFPVFYPVGTLLVSAQSTIFVVLGGVLLLLSLRRLIADRVEKQRLAGEFEAARVIQQFLLESRLSSSDEWSLETFYLPAQEVGGDFYHVRDLANRSRIVLVGDVSGKGLKAAMLVSQAIGILRNEKSTSPGAILAALNEALYGHTGGGFVTCCCARFDPDGSVTIANAGHLAPYCGGEEVPVEPGLPLAVASGATYTETTAPGNAFVFISDGVVEAADDRRELFGFERTSAISMKSAAEIAEAARLWGQNDDITVVTVRRTAA